MSYPLLSKIQSPEDIQGFSTEELKALADEVRERIITVLATTGGHLASNLGAVELTLAMHKVFDSPTDKFIWDVSHQTYTHKLLTGRNDRFEGIRQFNGLCGFSHPKESPYDHFHAGHAGTALSLGLGVAKNRDLTQRNEYVVPVIGDATLTCGMTLEALNNVSADLKRFVVILNDNAMSISENVGGITRILSRLLSNPTTHKIQHELGSILSKIPAYGEALAKQGHKVAESLRNLFSPAAFFEQYGLSYIGPIDGHDVGKLVETFERVKDASGPVIVHILTQKGKGMDMAVKHPTPYHGAKPFDPETGEFIRSATAKPTFPKVFGAHMLEMAEKDPSIVAVTPAMSYGSCLDGLMKKFPERCLDVGIAESHAVTFCGGIAYGKKMKVVASIYSTFLQRGFDNLFHDVCLQELPVVFAIDRGGLSAADGATHHGIYDISFLNAMPNMVITQPRDGDMLKDLLESAFSYGRPTAIRYPNMATEVSGRAIQQRPLGQGEVLVEGEDVLLIGLGHMSRTALQVREQLQDYGINATVLDPVFVKPLDSDLLCQLLMTHRRIVTIEEHSVISGLGSILNNFLMTNEYSNIKVVNCGIPEAFIDQGSHGELIDKIGLTPEKITQRLVGEFSLSKSTLTEKRGF